jgi:tetratricopeptide (TPR) repeat protein
VNSSERTPLTAENPDLCASLSHALFRKGDFERALQHADAAIAHGQETGDLQNLRGNIFDRMGLSADSIAAYERAVSVDPNLALARCNLGLAYQKAGYIDRAIACWEETIAVIPSSVDARIALSLARMEARQLAEAETLLRQAYAARYNPPSRARRDAHRPTFPDHQA